MENFIKEIQNLEDAIFHLDNVIDNMECCECRSEHIQLREWLKELLWYKSNYGSTTYIISDEERPCCICGKPTKILNMNAFKRFCSEECEEKYYEFKKEK